MAFIAFVKTQWFGQALPISPMKLCIFISTIRSFTVVVVVVVAVPVVVVVVVVRCF